jgi:hypothetical protein
MSQVKAANSGYGKAKKGYFGNKKAHHSNGYKSPRMNGGWSSGSESNGGSNGLKSSGIDWTNVLGFEPSKVLKGGSALEYDHWAGEFKCLGYDSSTVCDDADDFSGHQRQVRRYSYR